MNIIETVFCITVGRCSQILPMPFRVIAYEITLADMSHLNLQKWDYLQNETKHKNVLLTENTVLTVYNTKCLTATYF